MARKQRATGAHSMPQKVYLVKGLYGSGYNVISKLEDLGANQIAGIYTLEGVKQKKVRHEMVDLLIPEGADNGKELV